MSATTAAATANPADLLKLIQSMNAKDLGALVKAAEKEQAERQQKIKDIYGEWFCDSVGVNQLYDLPEVQADEIGLPAAIADHNKYPSNCVLPSHLKNASAVRGIMGTEWPRPFVAVKIEMLDPTTRKVVHVVVELIFKRYGLNGDGKKGAGYEDNYVTALQVTSSKKETLVSNLYSSGGMSNAQVVAIKDLLEGKTIVPPIRQFGKDYLIRMVQS